MSATFTIVILFVLVLNGGLAALQCWLLRRRPPRRAWLERAMAFWAVTMSGLFTLQLLAPASWTPFLREWLYFPLAVEMVWNLLLLQPLILGLIVVVLAARWSDRRKSLATARPAGTEGVSRREFVRLATYGAAPALALGLGVHGTMSRYDLRVRELNVPVRGLPPELEGFIIAHVSDLHSGVYCGPDRLGLIRDAINDQKADLIAITGDIINHELRELPDAFAAMQRLESRLGTFLCEGNHDVIPGPNLVRRACAQSGLPMLFNTSSIVPLRGGRLILGGLPWMRSGFEKNPEIVDRLFPERQPGDVRILLAHHPHLFDIAGSADLVLAGHTHGGQIMLGEDFGLGPLFFKYWSGLYRQDGNAMVVSNGCGDWFPCRIGAPAEIGRLRLTAAV